MIKRAGLKEKNTPLSVRVPSSLLEAFNDHCGSLGISVSDGVRLLMQDEINSKLKEQKEDQFILALENLIKEYKKGRAL